MEALKEAAKQAAAETAATYGWGMVVLVAVLLGFLLLVLYGTWQAAKWAKPRAEQFIAAAVSTMEQNAATLEKQHETLATLTAATCKAEACKAEPCKWTPPDIRLERLRGQG